MTTDYAAYYEALELPPGAQPDEVKRAYFRLLRQYSPETSPEEFKRIRAAYEALKDGPPEIEEPPFPLPTNSFLQTALEMCAKHARAGDYEAASSAYESLMKITPDEPYILLGLANSQRLAGHPQKAAKTALRLAELRPDSRDAWRIAATETYSRGWYKKSLPMFRKAFGLGEKRLDFLTDYAAAAADNGEYKECGRVNREILKTAKWTKDNAEYAVEAYYNLARWVFNKSEAVWLLDSYAAFLPGCRRLHLGIDALLAPVSILSFDHEELMKDVETYRKADDCLVLIGSIRSGEKHPMLESVRIYLFFAAIEADKRFHDDMWTGLAEASFFDSDAFSDLSRMLPRGGSIQELKTFSTLNAKLCLMKEAPEEFRQDADIVEKDYPLLYEAQRDFLDQVRAGDTADLFGSLKRQFMKMYHKFTASHFQQRYPEEFPTLYRETRIHGDSQPFVRDGKKVGRNDPCPCGSGKKFKKCCMGKGVYD